MKANSERLKPSSTRRALASLDVHPWRLAMRLRRLSLSVGRRMLMTTERVFLVFLMAILRCNCCKYCSITARILRAFLYVGAFPLEVDRDNHSTEGCCQDAISL